MVEAVKIAVVLVVKTDILIPVVLARLAVQEGALVKGGRKVNVEELTAPPVPRVIMPAKLLEPAAKAGLPAPLEVKVGAVPLAEIFPLPITARK